MRRPNPPDPRFGGQPLRPERTTAPRGGKRRVRLRGHLILGKPLPSTCLGWSWTSTTRPPFTVTTLRLQGAGSAGNLFCSLSDYDDHAQIPTTPTRARPGRSESHIVRNRRSRRVSHDRVVQTSTRPRESARLVALILRGAAARADQITMIGTTSLLWGVIRRFSDSCQSCPEVFLLRAKPSPAPGSRMSDETATLIDQEASPRPLVGSPRRDDVRRSRGAGPDPHRRWANAMGWGMKKQFTSAGPTPGEGQAWILDDLTCSS